jgi:hypothetical protein
MTVDPEAEWSQFSIEEDDDALSAWPATNCPHHVHLSP